MCFAENDLRADGNRNWVIDSAYDATGVFASATKTTWTYDALNRLTQEHSDVGNNNTSDAGDYTDDCTYDRVGSANASCSNSRGLIGARRA